VLTWDHDEIDQLARPAPRGECLQRRRRQRVVAQALWLESHNFDTSTIEDNDSFYQEFKLSAQTGRFDWVGGVSYYSETAEQASDTLGLPWREVMYNDGDFKATALFGDDQHHVEVSLGF
jgi:hypothetical protein